MINKIKYFFQDILHYVKFFFWRIHRVFLFARMGRNDRDWDYVFLYELIEFKLKLMSHHFTECEPYIGKDKRKLDLAVNLIERINHKDYSDNYNKYKKKWGELDWYFIPSPNKGYSRMMDRREDRMTPEQIKKMHTDLMVASKADDALKQQDIEMFFDICKKHSQRWWV